MDNDVWGRNIAIEQSSTPKMFSEHVFAKKDHSRSSKFKIKLKKIYTFYFYKYIHWMQNIF